MRRRIVGFGSFGEEAGYNKSEGEIPPQSSSGGSGYVPFYPATGSGYSQAGMNTGVAGAIVLAGVAGFILWSLISG